MCILRLGGELLKIKLLLIYCNYWGFATIGHQRVVLHCVDNYINLFVSISEVHQIECANSYLSQPLYFRGEWLSQPILDISQVAFAIMEKHTHAHEKKKRCY